MPAESFTRKLSELRSFTLRFGVRFMHIRHDEPTARIQACETVPLRLCCVRPLRRGLQPPKSVEEEESAFALGVTELKNGYIDFLTARRIPLEFYEKNLRAAGIVPGDLLIASTGATIGKVDLFQTNDPAIANNHVTIVRVDQQKYVPEVLLAILRSRYFQFQVERDYSGSAQPEIYPNELSAMRIPQLSSQDQIELAARISDVEEAIALARTGLRKAEDIINEILCAEFGYPLKEHCERERVQHFTACFHTMTAGFTLRNSAKFHHPSFELTERFFARTAHERVKAFAAIPIRLGATATKPDFVEEGAAYYVHPGATKRQEVIATDDCHQVTEKFYAATQRRFGLRRGDVVLNRAGEGTIGKSGLWDSDEPAIASDFTMRIRFNERINPRFALFYFQSVMFQAQVAREKRGMGNMTNIFPPEVEQMLIVACEKPKQDALARDITAELQRRTNALASIESKRDEIMKLIDEAIRG